LDRLNRALIYWPKWQRAMDEKQRIEQEQVKREARIRFLEDLASAKKMLEARSELERFVRAYGEASIGELKTRIYDGVKNAEGGFGEAEQTRKAGRPEDAIEKYEAALGFSADLEQAKQALAACPPPGPVDLRVETAGNGLRLKWQGVKARGSINY